MLEIGWPIAQGIVYHVPARAGTCSGGRAQVALWFPEVFVRGFASAEVQQLSQRVSLGGSEVRRRPGWQSVFLFPCWRRLQVTVHEISQISIRSMHSIPWSHRQQLLK